MSDPQLRWFRTWTDIVDDAKLLLLAPGDRWYYVALLALKRNGMLDEGDKIDVTDRKVGVRLRLDDRERDELRRRLVEANLIDASWQPSGWDKRQFESDSSAVRTRKYRRNKKRHCDVTVTSLQRHRDASESESESESDKTPVVPTGDAPTVRVFEHWKTVFGHPSARLDAKRRRLIAGALKLYPESELFQAISGYLKSPFHMGENEDRKRYDGLGLMLRDAEHIDAGLRFHAEPNQEARRASNGLPFLNA